MKKLTIVVIGCIAVASLAGCVGKGKGKTPPPAVVTKG
jgi:predicted small lipoprotein YifL